MSVTRIFNALIQAWCAGYLFDYFAQASEHNWRDFNPLYVDKQMRFVVLHFPAVHHLPCELFHYPTVDITFK